MAWIRVVVRSGWILGFLKVNTTGFSGGAVLGSIPFLILSTLLFNSRKLGWKFSVAMAC